MKDIEMSKTKQKNNLKKKEEKRCLSEHNVMDPIVKRNNHVKLPKIDNSFKNFKINENEKNMNELKNESKPEKSDI